MREAIGGTWIMGIVIVFVVLFSSFLAYSISYTKAFNVKNQIINYIEHKEGFTKSSNDVANIPIEQLLLEADNIKEEFNNVEAKAYYYIMQAGYNKEVAKKIPCPDGEGKSYSGGYCIKKICQNSSSPKSNVYYKVTTYIAVEIPVLQIVVKIPVSGETRTIYSVNQAEDDELECY
ncbi:MAG: hypothetical protein IKR57_04510 [Bacilli bacterium]|nr:hypothetical protein [Bacilli bacterium]